MTDPNGVVAPPEPMVGPAHPLPPPTTQRRPRVREVSSRFMSPSIQSNSTPNPNPNSDFPRSKSVQRRLLKMDENHLPETNRKLDGSTTPSIPSTVVKKQTQHRVKGAEQKTHHNTEVKTFSSRPDTPTADRIVPSRYRQVSSVYRSNSLNSSVSSSISSISSTSGGVSDATRLLQEVSSDVENKLSKVLTSSRDDMDSCKNSSSVKGTGLDKGSSSCPNSPLCPPSTKLRNGIDTRSSMPDVDKWLEERSGGDCSRSLNFSSSKLGGGLALPPHPSSGVRLGLDAKKGKKVGINHQEDLHGLKMLNNHYMQWRFANARSDASMLTQKREAERKFYALNKKISDMRDGVMRKRHELMVLRRINTCATVVDAQLPYLDEWSTLEESYSTSLSATTNALLNSSIRLPLGGVKADPVELKEALESAVKVMELIGSHIQRHVIKAEEMDVSLSKLGRMASEEKALIEECGDVLSKTQVSQFQECSLQCALMQFHRSNNIHQHKINEAT